MRCFYVILLPIEINAYIRIFLLLVRIYSAVYFKRHVVHIVRHTFSGLKHHFSFANFQLAPRCAEVSF